MACGCSFQSGANSKLWLTEVSDCANKPFSTGTTFSPVFTGYDDDSADFVCGLESFNITYGVEVQEIFVAALAGSSGTVAGVRRGTGELVIVHDSAAPIGDVVRSGRLHDFVVTLNGDSAADATADERVVGRIRVGQFQMPFQLNGEPIRITIPFTVDGRTYGMIIGESNDDTDYL